MDLFEKISLSQIIWYLVPGLGLIFFLLFPLLVLNPDVVKIFFDTLGIFGLIIVGIILGFFLDGLRLYRFRPKYGQTRTVFFKELQTTIDSKLDPYFIQVCINDLAIKNNISDISLHHSIWIMLGHFTILAFLEAIFWVLTLAYIYAFLPMEFSIFGANVSKETAILVNSSFSILFFLIGFRFLIISEQDQKNTNKMFIDFAKQYRKQIKKLLNIVPLSK
jgi:hypothetical protein